MAYIHDEMLETMSALAVNMGFFSSYMYSRQKVITFDEPWEGIDTAATDGKNLFFCMVFMLSLTRPERAFVLAHEIMHDVYGHSDYSVRATARGYVISSDGNRKLPWSHELHNIAADARINADLIECRLTMPKVGILFAWVTKDMDVLDIYEKLINDGGGTTTNGGRIQVTGKGEVSGAEGLGFDEHLFDENATPESEGEQEARRQAVETAIMHGKLAGKVPSSAERLAEQLKRPKVKWQDVLKDMIVTIRGADGLDWLSFEKRDFLLTTALNPARKSERVSDIVFLVDTSGSTADFVDQFLSEIASVASELEPRRILIMWVGTRVAHVDELDNVTVEDIATLKIHGGGGTDLRSGFDWIADPENEIDNVMGLVILTDSYTEWPSEDPGYPVICATTNVDLTHPRWMQTVSVA